MKKTKILNLISTLDRGGAETFLYRLVTKMDHPGFENCVVSMTGTGSIGRELEESQIAVHSLDMSKGVPDIRGLFRLVQLVRHYKPDIIHCWMYHAFLLGIAAKLFFPKMKVVWNIRCSNMDLGKYGPVYDFTVRAAAWFSPLIDTLIANSFAGKRYHDGFGYRNNNWKVLQNGIDTEDYFPVSKEQGVRKELDIPENAFVIVYAARFDPQKDHKTFFQAVEICLKNSDDIHFILAGRGVEAQNPSIQRYMRNIKKKEHVHLLGERRDIKRVYAAANLASSSSCYGEGFPNVIGEAMAMGLPCIATDVGDSALIIGTTGVVVKVKDPSALAREWQRLIRRGGNYCLGLGQKATSRIQGRFSLQTVVNQYIALFSSIL